MVWQVLNGEVRPVTRNQRLQLQSITKSWHNAEQVREDVVEVCRMEVVLRMIRW